MPVDSARSCAEVRGQKWELVQVVDGANREANDQRPRRRANESGLRELQLAVLLNEVAARSANGRQAVHPSPTSNSRGRHRGLLVQVKGIRNCGSRSTARPGTSSASDTRTRTRTAKEVDTEIAFAEFQTVSGLTRPMRSVVTRGGKPVADLTIEKFTPLEKVDPKVFVIEE